MEAGHLSLQKQHLKLYSLLLMSNIIISCYKTRLPLLSICIGMQNNSSNKNPWTEIPLTDYEQHMSDSSVGQLRLLNLLTKKYLTKIKPETCLFMGIAGGNGLEHVDNQVTKNVT